MVSHTKGQDLFDLQKLSPLFILLKDILKIFLSILTLKEFPRVVFLELI